MPHFLILLLFLSNLTTNLPYLSLIKPDQDHVLILFLATSLMWHGVDIISPSSWEPQEEGMMSTAGSFPSVRNRGLSV
jgi:hypothetical protein